LLYGIHGWMHPERNRVGVLPLLWKKNKRGKTMKCWNAPCDGEMKILGDDTYHFFCICPKCKKEKAVLKVKK
jgi:hypothetical protein